MSTRSFTNAGVGSDPGSLTKAGNTISVDLSAIVGATVYRATLDPYVKPHQSRDRYVIRDGNGKVLKLLAPRYLGFDATEAVKSSMSSGRLVLTVEDPGQGFGSVISLDVLCDAPSPVPITQVDQAAARFQDGDTMITFAEVNPPHTQPEWTVGDYDDAMEAAGPDRSPKRRYRIYRSTSPFDDPADLAGAELVDEIMPLTGWNGRLHAYDPTGNHEKDVLEIPTLPVSDLTLAAPGTGIYVKRFEGAAPETAYYLVSHTLNGAEDFSSLVEGKNATGPVSETDGPGMTLLWQSEYIKGKWYWKPYIHMTLYYYVRWAAMPDWNVPNHAFNYRLGKSHDHVPAAPPLEISPHAWNGSLLGYYDWSWYTKGAMLLTFNLLYYNSYTAFHECAGTLRSYDDGTVQPFMHARVLDFIHNFAQPTYNIDMNRVIMTGGSMGGEAGNFWGMRSGHLLAYIDSSVGNTIPSEYITWEFESIGEWGPISWQSIYSNPQVVRFGYPEIKPSDNYVVWDYFHNPLWLKAHRGLDTPYITYANAPNDGGWEQAWKTTQAMMETKRPFNFTWGQNGHGQWTEPLGLDYTLKQSLPAFGRCSLDDDLGTNPNNCALEGHINRYLLWDVNTIVDESDRWEMDIHLANYALKPRCTADVTLRRLQKLEHDPGMTYTWILEEGGVPRAMGAAHADEDGLITIPGLPFSKTTRRLTVLRDPGASLEANAHFLTARSTGAVHLDLIAGAANAQRNYVMLGSVSGTAPGTPLPGGQVVLPLNWDAVTDLTVLLLNSPVLVNFMGTLDGDGNSSADLVLLSALPGSATGAVLYFAYALDGPWDFVSNPIGVEVVP